MTKEEIIKDLKSEIKRRRALLITTKGEYAKMLHSDIADLLEEKNRDIRRRARNWIKKF